MKWNLARAFTILVVLAATVAAAPALAGNATVTPFSAPFEYGGKISFELQKKEGKPRKVRRIKIRKMAADCEGSLGRLNFKIFGKTPVLDDRSFAVRSEDGKGGEAIVRGQFSRGFTQADGTARLYGSFNLEGEGASECDSKKQSFDATPVG